MGRKFIWLLLLLLPFLMSCGNRFSDIEEIDQYIESYLADNNQFNVLMIVDASITVDDEETSFSEEMAFNIQVEPYYISYTENDMMYLEYIEDSIVKSVSYDSTTQVEGKYLYTYSEYNIDFYELDTLGLELTSEDFVLEKTGQGSFVIEANIGDLLSEYDYKTIESIIGSLGNTKDYLDDAVIRMEIFIDNDEIRYIVSMNLDIETYDMAIDLTMDVTITDTTFTPVDISDTTLFFPITGGEGSAVIDIDEHILYPAHHAGMVSYDIYLEPGKYALNILEADFSGRRIYVDIYDKSTYTSVLTFVDVYNSTYDLYETSINNYFNIDEAGYYELFLEYPESNINVITQLEKYEYETDGIETPDLVINESGTYNYEVEGPYDFYSVFINVPGYTNVKINNSNGSKVYFTEVGQDELYHTFDYNGTLSFMNYDPHTIYIFDDEATSGTVTIELDHLTTTDGMNVDSMVDMLNTYDVYLYTTDGFPDQYLKVVITEQGFYEFYYDIDEGDSLLDDALFTSEGEWITNVDPNKTIPLSTGVYYYKVLGDDRDRTYRIRYDETTKNVITYNLTALDKIDILTGNLKDLDLIWGEIEHSDDFIVYNFTLTEETDFVISNEREYQLYNAIGERISLNLHSYTPYGVYRLDVGEYFVTVTLPTAFNDDNLPYEYHIMIGELNVPGSENDTSIYPYFEILEPKTPGYPSIDYALDIDGYTVIVEKETTYGFSAVGWTTIFKGTSLLYTFYNSGTYTLEPGIYYVIGANHSEHDPWHLFYSEAQ